MGRYDKVKYWNGSAWAKPSQVKVWNGTSWVDYGADASNNTNSMIVWDGTAWIRKTLNRSDYSIYNTAAQVLPIGSFGTAVALSLSAGGYTVSTRRHYAGWTSYLWNMLTNVASNWWCGTSANNDSTEDWIQFEWTTPQWIQSVQFRASATTYWSAVPVRVEASFRNANGTWTGETTYTCTRATGSGAWNGPFTFNMQTPAGYTGVKVRFLNNATYKNILQPPRIGTVYLYLGTISTGTNWV